MQPDSLSEAAPTESDAASLGLSPNAVDATQLSHTLEPLLYILDY